MLLASFLNRSLYPLFLLWFWFSLFLWLNTKPNTQPQTIFSPFHVTLQSPLFVFDDVEVSWFSTIWQAAIRVCDWLSESTKVILREIDCLLTSEQTRTQNTFLAKARMKKRSHGYKNPKYFCYSNFPSGRKPHHDNQNTNGHIPDTRREKERDRKITNDHKEQRVSIFWQDGFD